MGPHPRNNPGAGRDGPMSPAVRWQSGVFDNFYDKTFSRTSAPVRTAPSRPPAQAKRNGDGKKAQRLSDELVDRDVDPPQLFGILLLCCIRH